MKQKKIWLVSPFSPAEGAGVGGVKTHTELLASLLRAEGFELTALIPAGAAGPWGAAPGVELVNSEGEPYTRGWQKALGEKAGELLSSGRPAAIISEGYMAAGLQDLAKEQGIPLAAFVHNFHLVHFFNKSREIVGARTLARYLLLSVPQLAVRLLSSELPFFRACGALLPVSGFNSSLLARAYRIPEAAIQPFYNWVEESYFSAHGEARRAVRAELGLREEEVVVLMAGSAWAPKGFREGLLAFERAAAAGIQMKVVIAGIGADASFAARHIRNAAALSRIVPLGPVPRNRLAQLYKAADIFLQPSRLSEGCSYTMIEALASGLPLITTDVGGNPEIPHGAAEISPPDPASLATALEKLAANPALRKTMGAEARAVARRYFSEAAAGEQLRGLLERLKLR